MSAENSEDKRLCKVRIETPYYLLTDTERASMAKSLDTASAQLSDLGAIDNAARRQILRQRNSSNLKRDFNFLCFVASLKRCHHCPWASYASQ